MDRALNYVEEWCKRESLWVNSIKLALIPFTNKKNLKGLKTPTFFNKQLQIDSSVKYLGLILHKKLTWNLHLQKVINKSKMALMIA